MLTDFLQFVYGVFMGTSTKYVKRPRSFLFPMSRTDYGDKVAVFCGGSANTVFYRGEPKFLLNPQQGASRAYVLKQVDEVDFCLRAQTLSEFGTPEDELLSGEKLQQLPQSVELRECPLGYKEPFRVLLFHEERLAYVGCLANNQVHPPLFLYEGLNVEHWMQALESFAKELHGWVIVPQEGAIGDEQILLRMRDYLKALSNPDVEFSECRKSFDWSEVIGYTSLEENFEILRHQNTYSIRL